jgi:hypothetical protein
MVAKTKAPSISQKAGAPPMNIRQRITLYEAVQLWEEEP